MNKGNLLYTALLCLFANTTYGQTSIQLKKTIDSLYDIDQKMQWKIKEAIDNKLSYQ